MSALESLRQGFEDWLVRDAYPLWSLNGVDQATGGFVEALDQNGLALTLPRRARIHPRQVYAFSQARKLGWRGDAFGIMRNGMNNFARHYQRADGLFLTLAAADGSVQDGRALLYDQAFVLLGYAAAAVQLEAIPEWEHRALALRDLIDAHFYVADGAYRAEFRALGYESNPHMHLLEAYVAWAEVGKDRGWIARAQCLVEIAVTRFIRKDSGAIGEFYLPTMQPTPAASGSSIEPGHQFEWGWLLLRCERWLGSRWRNYALRLIALGEQYGVGEGFAVNALGDDLSVHDAGARLWPQCERLKAALLAATLTDEPQYWKTARAAADSLRLYLNTRTPGLWFDLRMPKGEFKGDVVPASTFYHLVGAIAALNVAHAHP
jgi:mannose/cellobiose epimerase-like protein (N-acyl-D-glucosamine 2-epimerase family)